MNPASPRVAVITPVKGRNEHLRRQQLGLRASRRTCDLRVIVTMDHELGATETEHTDICVPVPVPRTGRLPLARARNAGAAAALDAGANLLVFLDVDCIPSPTMLERYVSAHKNHAGLHCGPVHYLDPPGPGGYDLDALPEPPRGHPARPVPAEDEIVVTSNPDLFWSLSFAVSARDWETLGGFCERYEGYGGEDTDFARTACSAGFSVNAVGGAWAFHQWHPTSEPPTQHLADILRNAAVFHDRWGSWPMHGWLQQFADLRLATFDPESKSWVTTESGRHPHHPSTRHFA
jgi:hypothetical protein